MIESIIVLEEHTMYEAYLAYWRMQCDVMQ